MNKKLLFFPLAIFLFVMVRLFCGVYSDAEFYEDHFFIKHRLVWKWHFHSPLGMSDMKLEDLPKEKQIEQRYFDEFVSGKGLAD